MADCFIIFDNDLGHIFLYSLTQLNLNPFLGVITEFSLGAYFNKFSLWGLTLEGLFLVLAIKLYSWIWFRLLQMLLQKYLFFDIAFRFELPHAPLQVKSLFLGKSYWGLCPFCLPVPLHKSSVLLSLIIRMWTMAHFYKNDTLSLPTENWRGSVISDLPSLPFLPKKLYPMKELGQDTLMSWILKYPCWK